MFEAGLGNMHVHLGNQLLLKSAFDDAPQCLDRIEFRRVGISARGCGAYSTRARQECGGLGGCLKRCGSGQWLGFLGVLNESELQMNGSLWNLLFVRA